MNIMPLMQCGCVAQGFNETTGHIPWCVVHDCGIVVIEEPNLEGREATCPYCKKSKPSSKQLPFFSFCKDEEKDTYYCGCRGWD